MTFCRGQISPVFSPSLPARFFVYLNERFPPLAYSLMTALFVVSGISLSSVLRLGHVALSMQQFVVGFAVIFGLFFQLRVADEWKDCEEDALYQSERPVPRGLISLRELTWIAAITACIQILLVSIYDCSMLLQLAIVWGYFVLMSKEFFCSEFLRRQPALYVLSHMFILVLSDLFITALDWWHTGTTASAKFLLLNFSSHLPVGLILFLGAGFANGLVIEMGRKIRNSDEERPGVETYSKLCGLPAALYLLLTCMLTAHVLIGCALYGMAGGVIACAVLALTDMLIVMAACLMTRTKMQKPLTNLSNLSVLLSYAVVFITSMFSGFGF